VASSKRHERVALQTTHIGELEVARGGNHGAVRHAEAPERHGAALSGELGRRFEHRTVASAGQRGATCSGELGASESPRWCEQAARSGEREAMLQALGASRSSRRHSARAVLRALGASRSLRRHERSALQTAHIGELEVARVATTGRRGA
jgi:hypothetical protein